MPRPAEREELVVAAEPKQPSPQALVRAEKAQKQAREGEKAWAEYEASATAADANRARLKALRLAKEAAERAAAPAPAVKPKGAKAGTKAASATAKAAKPKTVKAKSGAVR
jgi:hypothetical protein